MRPSTSIELATAGNASKPRPALNHCFKFANHSQYLPLSARGVKRIAALCSAAVLLGFATASTSAQNAIDRSLLLRQQQEQDLQNRLDNAPANSVPAIPVQPSESVDNWLAPPKLELPPAQLELPPAPPPSADLQSQPLYQSQQQRLLERQMQNRSLSAPIQEQQNQIQLQQFQREDQAERLGRDILRSSNNALPGLH
jgi:hypothetical protein